MIYNLDITTNIFSIEKKKHFQRRGKYGLSYNYHELKISFDKFDEMAQILKKGFVFLPFDAIIYDEDIIDSDEAIKLRVKFLKELNKQSFVKIEFKVSNSTLPIYKEIMKRIYWNHNDITNLEVTKNHSFKTL